ncbi:MAG TPA: hypothetical protein VGR37_02975 [Longimicrobiaceae bacterium]|nr:hypothetical protein [Longimicrobiaceae bacterium]
MARPILFALLGLLGLAFAAPAQERVSPARLTLAPVLGVRTPLARDQRTTVVVPSLLLPAVVELGPDRVAGGVAGVEADLRLVGPVGVSGGFLYTAGDPIGVLLLTDDGVLAHISAEGPSAWFFHADLSVRLPDMKVDEDWPTPRVIPAGYLVAGAARIRQEFGGSVLALADDDVEESWGMHLAYRAQFPVGSRNLVLQASLEDYIPFWNRDHERARLSRAIELHSGRALATGVAYNRTHIVMLNLGLALRL